ncbi:MAG TPA: hypothetical protein VMR80_06835 [Candidatus Acidoferrum sp.]|nr:hypothetical protein [Candidatus Acidoferrum sp.]
MKFTLGIALALATAALIFAGMFRSPAAGGTVGIAAGTPILAPRGDSPERALSILLADLQRRNWPEAFSAISKTSDVDRASLIQEWMGTNGSLRAFSNLESFDLRPMHATADDAQIRAHLRWTTPVGPIEGLKDFHLVREGDVWRVVWPKIQLPSVPAQVVPVTYLRWDLVTGGSGDEWGSHNVDAPHVRIISMNAVNSASGAVVMGEVVNEDAIPAFVNVNATLLDGNNSTIDEESSFDRIAHVLLPKQVTPYRIDFPQIDPGRVKNVHMDVRATLVPASADPVIGVMNQKMDADAQGNHVLRGELLNQSGQVVNIPHVIASFYDGSGRVIWVSDGYVDQALLPLSSEPFSVEVPRTVADKIKSFHVVVNQYSLQRS